MVGRGEWSFPLPESEKKKSEQRAFSLATKTEPFSQRMNEGLVTVDRNNTSSNSKTTTQSGGR